MIFEDATPNPCRIRRIYTAYGVLYAMEPWDTATATYHWAGITLSFIQRLDEHTRLVREYSPRRLDAHHYELHLSPRERHWALRVFCRYQSLDRSWLEPGEPEVWQLDVDGHCIHETITLALRG
jgi:hypothetical protein